MEIKQKVTKKRLKNKQKAFLAAYIEHKGHITNACKDAEINRKTYYDWMKEPFFAEKFDEALEIFNDTIETNIRMMAVGMDRDMLKFWAKHQMRHRGFNEKQEIELSGTVNSLSPGEIEEEIKRLLK